MQHQRLLRAGRWLPIALVIVFGIVLTATPAQARPLDTSGYSLTLTISNGNSLDYGTTAEFLAYLTMPPGAPGPNPSGLVLKVDGQGYASFFTVISGKLTIRTTVGEFPPGTHTAIQTVYIAASQITLQSSPVTFTVRKLTPELECAIQNLAYVYHPGQPLHITSSFGTNTTPLDWQDGTYTIQFAGPVAVTDANVPADSNDVITVPAPNQIGSYKATCKFNGTSSVNPVTGSTMPLTVSLEHQVGSVQVFTNPTTLVSGQPSDMYVVFHAAPGLPTPTGRFNVEVDNAVSTPITLGPDGTGSAHFDKMPVFGNNHFVIAYSGDPYYTNAVYTFPLTNPPIPAGGGSGGSGSGSGGTTPTSQATATPSGTATATGSDEAMVAATPTTATSASVFAVQGAKSSGDPIVWLAVLLILLALCAGVGGFIFWRRRASSASSVSTYTPSPDFTPPQGPPLDE